MHASKAPVYLSGMGLITKILLFALLKIYVIHGETICPVSFCGNSNLKIRLPFILETQTPPNNCTYFNLSCNTAQGTTILSFPNSGDFYVQVIDYVEQNIQIYDPGYCLIKRLMNVSLSSSPLKADYYENYNFYVCPRDSLLLDSHVYPIECLSNSTNFMIATRDMSEGFLEAYGCRSFGSWLIPVSWPGQFESSYGLHDNIFLFLKWNANVCKDCEEFDNHKSGEKGPKPMTKIIAIALSMPALIIMTLTCCSVFFLHLMRMTRDKRNNSEAAAEEVSAPTAMATPQTTLATTVLPPPATSNSGLDESTIMACTETVVLSESDAIPSVHISTCSICLEGYCTTETLRLISRCRHSFHACCIEQWLGKNSTCPVCRTSLSDVAL